MLFDIIGSGGKIDFITLIVQALSSLAVIFLTLPVHEFAHAYTAVKLGDPTPRYTGRLTLNPLKHIDYLGAASILLFGFGWAKPVQVNTRYFKNPKRDMAITAVAGPISNLVVCFISIFIATLITEIFPFSEVAFYIGVFLINIGYINVYLAVFNLIPIPPFDGSRLLSAFLPYKYYYALMRYERYLMYGVLILCWTGILSRPLGIVTDVVYNAIATAATFVFKFF
ncbi:MAG: site-2 protease family protein [Clostridia bacterium]|nr:site-2 protease family protein [Clostridia bacterium]